MQFHNFIFFGCRVSDIFAETFLFKTISSTRVTLSIASTTGFRVQGTQCWMQWLISNPRQLLDYTTASGASSLGCRVHIVHTPGGLFVGVHTKGSYAGDFILGISTLGICIHWRFAPWGYTGEFTLRISARWGQACGVMGVAMYRAGRRV
jgi:hypothetical protein